MLMPKKTKFRKQHRGRMKGLAKGGRTLLHGEYGLQALEPCWMTSRQIEATRMVVSRGVKKIGEWFLRVFPDKPITAKPAETRMGKGKGAPEYWASVIKRGRIIFEVKGVDEARAKAVLRSAAHKLPFKTKIVSRETQETATEVNS